MLLFYLFHCSVQLRSIVYSEILVHNPLRLGIIRAVMG